MATAAVGTAGQHAPAAPMTARLTVVIRGLSAVDIQTIHAAADKPRVTTIPGYGGVRAGPRVARQTR